jgi:hypothetical protein
MSSEAEVLSPLSQARSALARNWLSIAQLALVVLVVHLYDIEGPPFFKVMVLTFAGFLLSMALPVAKRLPLFIALSLGGILWVLGAADGTWLIALGLLLIGLAHMPGPMSVRVAALVIAGAGFGVLRAGFGETPWSSAVWPILGSMFMFRTVLYVRAVSTGQVKKSWTGALAYFFMLPNVAFPLFPVVDYQTFRRTHFDRADTAIYEQGMLWVARGIFQLVLYRFVYYNVLNDPTEVAKLSDLVRYMLGTFLLYLRVSGQFHLIVGLLHLFGFRLPETHKLYYLAHSFTELWRRINIYWTDFMMKVVFYPTYFKVKKRGPAAALAIATTAVFVTTWLLHSYQWFWLRGGFPMTAPDFLFWAILGALVVRGALKELKGAKAPKAAGGWNWRLGLKAGFTFVAFCFLWSLWSAQSVTQWVWMLGAAGTVDPAGVVLALATVATIVWLGGRNWEADKAATGWSAFLRKPAVRTIVPMVVLLALAQPAVQSLAPASAAQMLASLQTTGLNEMDAARKHRGYYEQLDVRSSVNTVAQADVEAGKADWKAPSEVGIIRERNDVLSRDLYPSVRVTWNGKQFSTNSWGMRDQQYALEKPPGTLRIALMGPSHVMGNGVADGETFEALVEERLNREFRLEGFQRFEILNFGVDGYALPQQLALLRERALSFEPDVVIFTQYHRGQVMTETYLLKIKSTGAVISDVQLRGILSKAGLDQLGTGSVPVPFKWGRRIAKWVGIDARIPYEEAKARARSITEEVNDWSIMQIAQTSRSIGAQPAMLALNAIIDDAPEEIPNIGAAHKAGLPIFDLFDIFPSADREALRAAPWDEHPNATGHRLIADKLYGQLTQLLVRHANKAGADDQSTTTMTEAAR